MNYLIQYGTMFFFVCETSCVKKREKEQKFIVHPFFYGMPQASGGGITWENESFLVFWIETLYYDDGHEWPKN